MYFTKHVCAFTNETCLRNMKEYEVRTYEAFVKNKISVCVVILIILILSFI